MREPEVQVGNSRQEYSVSGVVESRSWHRKMELPDLNKPRPRAWLEKRPGTGQLHRRGGVPASFSDREPVRLLPRRALLCGVRPAPRAGIRRPPAADRRDGVVHAPNARRLFILVAFLPRPLSGAKIGPPLGWWAS